MRSTHTRVIEMSKVRGLGELPGFLPLLHRHFEKSCPTVVGTEATLTAPTDLLEFSVPEILLDGIEGIEIIYKKEK